MHLNLQQLAESFGVSEKVVQDWVKHEALPHVMDRGRPIFQRAEVAAWGKTRGIEIHTGFLAEDPVPLREGSGLMTLLKVGGVWRDVAGADARATLVNIVTHLPGVGAPICRLLGQRILSPGGLVWAPVGHGFALPHLSARVALGPTAGVVALVLLCEPLPLDEATPDGEPVRRLFFFMAPTPRGHLDLLAQLARLVRHEPFHQALDQGADDETIFRAATTALSQSPSTAMVEQDAPL
jgi:PTS system nitrogen regulatory IIA component